MGKKKTTAKSYIEYYKDPRWQKKRLKVMERDNFTCRSCGAKDVTLNVHHTYYEKGKKPWEYPIQSLMTWCEDCHEKRYSLKKHIDEAIGQLSYNELEGLYYLMVISIPQPVLKSFGIVFESPFQVSMDDVGKMILALASAYEHGMSDEMDDPHE